MSSLPGPRHEVPLGSTRESASRRYDGAACSDDEPANPSAWCRSPLHVGSSLLKGFRVSPAATDQPDEPVPRLGAVARGVSWSKAEVERARPDGLRGRVKHIHRWTSASDSRIATSASRQACSLAVSPIGCSFGTCPSPCSPTGPWASSTAIGRSRPFSTLGVPPVVAQTMSDASWQPQQARWWLVIVGGCPCCGRATWGKALVLVHASVWDVAPTPIRKQPSASLGFTGSVLGFGASMASMALVQWVRSESHAFGLVAMLASAVVPLVFWLAVSRRLPHRGSGWRELRPGAVLVAIGVHAMYLFTTWFLGPKLASATETVAARSPLRPNEAVTLERWRVAQHVGHALQHLRVLDLAEVVEDQHQRTCRRSQAEEDLLPETGADPRANHQVARRSCSASAVLRTAASR
jgi:hypothetical protein